MKEVSPGVEVVWEVVSEGSSLHLVSGSDEGQARKRIEDEERGIEREGMDLEGSNSYKW